MLSKKLAAIAAVSLISASSAAVAQSVPASRPATAAVERSGAGVQGESELDRRGIGIYIIGAIVLAALIWGAIELLDDSDSP